MITQELTNGQLATEAQELDMIEEPHETESSALESSEPDAEPSASMESQPNEELDSSEVKGARRRRASRHRRRLPSHQSESPAE